MGDIVAIANAKGGVGKTTTTTALALGLTRRGMKILLIDADAQGNATQAAGVNGGITLAGIMKGLQGNPIQRRPLHYDVIPGDGSLSAMEIEGFDPKRFSKIIVDASKKYDVTLIDCPPNMGAIVASIINLCDRIVVPTLPEGLAVRSTNRFMDLVDKSGSMGKMSGILITFYQNCKLHNGAVQMLEKRYPGVVLHTKIRRSVALAEATTVAKNIFDYAPKSNGAKDYLALIDEIERKVRPLCQK